MAHETEDEAPKRRGWRKRRASTVEVKVVPEYPDERIGNFMRGLVLGALAGGIFTLLNVRQSGAETRAQLRARAEGLRAGVADVVATARTAVQDAIGGTGGEEDVWSPPGAGAEVVTLVASTAGGPPGGPAEASGPEETPQPGTTMSEVAEEMEAVPTTGVSHPGNLDPPPGGPAPEEPMPVPDEAPTTQLPPRPPQA